MTAPSLFNALCHGGALRVLDQELALSLRRLDPATPDVVLNQLWRHTQAQTSFPANMLAIRGGRPETLMLREIIEAFIKFREEVITRRSKFELFKARERAHILLGLVVAVTNLDEVVRIIRGSASPAEAREKLLAREWDSEQIRPYIQLVEAVEPQAALEASELYAVIAALPDDFRDVLVAVDVTGLSYKEAARALRIREGTVMSRLYRARQAVVRTLTSGT